MCWWLNIQVSFHFISIQLNETSCQDDAEVIGILAELIVAGAETGSTTLSAALPYLAGIHLNLIQISELHHRTSRDSKEGSRRSCCCSWWQKTNNRRTGQGEHFYGQFASKSKPNHQLPYLNAVVKEVQRIWPTAPIWMPHCVTEDDALRGLEWMTQISHSATYSCRIQCSKEHNGVSKLVHDLSERQDMGRSTELPTRKMVGWTDVRILQDCIPSIWSRSSNVCRLFCHFFLQTNDSDICRNQLGKSRTESYLGNHPSRLQSEECITLGQERWICICVATQEHHQDSLWRM